MLMECLDVDQGTGKQSKKEAKISRKAIYTMPALWKIQGCLSQVQNLPDLF